MLCCESIVKREEGVIPSLTRNCNRLQQISMALEIPEGSLFGDSDERALTDDEMRLIKGFRSLNSDEIRAFILSSITKK